jgi:hypothetical protein
MDSSLDDRGVLLSRSIGLVSLSLVEEHIGGAWSDIPWVVSSSLPGQFCQDLRELFGVLAQLVAICKAIAFDQRDWGALCGISLLSPIPTKYGGMGDNTLSTNGLFASGQCPADPSLFLTSLPLNLLPLFSLSPARCSCRALSSSRTL